MTDICSRSGCDQPVKARTLCATDYAYAYRHGTLPPKAPAPEGCSVTGCPGRHEARGLCQKHYLRYYTRGTTELTEPQRAMSTEDRFRSKVSAEPCACGECSGCLRWTKGKNGAGYGVFYVNGERVLAHRFAYELDVKPIPPLHQVDHVRDRGCRHRDCVKKEHLEPVSLEENLRRAQVGRRATNGKWQKAVFAEHAAERFWAKADRSGGPDAHWLWQAFIDQDGNAKAWWQGSTHMAREVAWTLAKGPVPEEKIPQQSCGRGDCVNPAHLVLIDRKADHARRAALARAGKQNRKVPVPVQVASSGTGRHIPGSAKLTAETVAQCRLRFAAGETQIALAAESGVTSGAMSLAIRGDTWPGPVNGVEPVPRGLKPSQGTNEFRAKMTTAGRKGAAARWHPEAPEGVPVTEPAPSVPGQLRPR